MGSFFGVLEFFGCLLGAFLGLLRLSFKPYEPYPSLSFVEYNSSQDQFFTPLHYFLAGHYLDPWDAGEGGPQNRFFFGFFCTVLGFQSWLQNWFQSFFIIFGLNFGFLFLGSWMFWVPFGSHLGPLEAFLRSLCSQKPLKNQWVSKGFWKWRFLVLWSSWWLFLVHLGPLGPLWSQNGLQNEFQHFF